MLRHPTGYPRSYRFRPRGDRQASNTGAGARLILRRKLSRLTSRTGGRSFPVRGRGSQSGSWRPRVPPCARYARCAMRAGHRAALWVGIDRERRWFTLCRANRAPGRHESVALYVQDLQCRVPAPGQTLANHRAKPREPSKDRFVYRLASAGGLGRLYSGGWPNLLILAIRRRSRAHSPGHYEAVYVLHPYTAPISIWKRPLPEWRPYHARVQAAYFMDYYSRFKAANQVLFAFLA